MPILSPIKQANLIGNYIENNDITLSDVSNADNQSFIHDSSDLNYMQESFSAGEEFIRDTNLTESYLENGEVNAIDEINAENTKLRDKYIKYQQSLIEHMHKNKIYVRELWRPQHLANYLKIYPKSDLKNTMKLFYNQFIVS